jgi:peptidoglycan-N-acetylglucosamine deacetylase
MEAYLATKHKLQLTFDDGPNPEKSALDPILAEVKGRGVIAAFFVLGEEVKKDKPATKKVLDAGHVLGNHSWDHLPKDVWNYSPTDLVKQFKDTHDEVKTATGAAMKHWRAPRGECGDAAKKGCHPGDRLSSLLVGPGKLYMLSNCEWHADSKDAQGSTTAAQMLSNISAALANTPAGSPRLLFHVVDHTAQALPTVLKELEKNGHTFVNFTQAS